MACKINTVTAHPTSQCHQRSSARGIGLVNRCANQRHVGRNDREALRSLEKRSCRKRIVQTSSLVVDDGRKLAGFQSWQIGPLVQFESDGVRLSLGKNRSFWFTRIFTHVTVHFQDPRGSPSEPKPSAAHVTTGGSARQYVPQTDTRVNDELPDPPNTEYAWILSLRGTSGDAGQFLCDGGQRRAVDKSAAHCRDLVQRAIA